MLTCVLMVCKSLTATGLPPTIIMTIGDRYHKWVEWIEEDGVYIGRCPDLITGIHGHDPVALYSELCAVVDDVIRHFLAENRILPLPTIRPMREVA